MREHWHEGSPWLFVFAAVALAQFASLAQARPAAATGVTAQWTPMQSGTTNGLTGVWGTSPREVFVVGSKGTILRYDGNQWRPMSVKGAPALIAVWGASGRDVFAVGDAGVILHYDGRAWTAMESGTKQNLICVWGTSGQDVYVVGYAGTVLHYDGRAWTPMATGTTSDFYGVWGTGRNDVFAVGGTPLPLPGRGEVLHYDGRTWSPMPNVRSPFLAGVWGSSGRDVFAVGVGHTVLRHDGDTWTAMPAGTRPAEGKPNLLTRVWGSGPRDVYVAGFDGVLLHFDGKSWSTVPCGTTESLGTIWGFSPEDVFIVGGGGTILHYGTKQEGATQGALDKRVSLDLKAMAPAGAFKLIASAIGYTVEVAADLAMPVDIVIPNVTAKTALTTICESIGCTWQADGTVIVVRKGRSGATLGSLARRNGTAAPGGGVTRSEMTERLNGTLPADMKFENAPMALVAERLGTATGIGISFVSETSGQTLSADVGNRTLMNALKVLSQQYRGAIVLTMKRKGAETDEIVLGLGSANRARAVRK